MQITPYLFFDGRAEEAAAFYCETLGARIETMLRYRDSPDPAAITPGSEDKVMHMALRIGDGTIFASDGHNRGTPRFEGIALVHRVADTAASERTFNALAEGGVVVMPLGETFFSPSFGMVADRFGVSWMIMVEK